MARPDIDGKEAAALLYGNDMSSDDRHPRPSLIPGVDYPITDSEERLLDLAYRKGFNDAKKLYQSKK